MTKEQAIQELCSISVPSGDFALITENTIEALHMAIDALREPSLHEGLDEAAGDYAIEVVPDNFIPDEGNGYKAAYTLPDIKAAFKAGAEWMAGQGVTKNGLVAAYDNGYLRVYTTILDNEDGIKFGDKVIIQIRKK